MSTPDLSRRDFLSAALRYGALAAGAGALLSSPAWLKRWVKKTAAQAYAATKLDELLRTAPLARYWISTESEGQHCAECHSETVAVDACHVGTVTPAAGHRHERPYVKCLLCAQCCMIASGDRGKCNVRMNANGELRSLVYGRPITIHIDPIEKKPFYHFLPGASAYSLATSGCPLHCRFCQNWEISQIHPEDYEADYTPPEALVSGAKNNKAPVIAFTYNEPTVFTEYLTDIARAARPQGVRSVLISCGFMREEPLTEMCSVLDAIKIDLKGFSADFYQRVCAADLQPVLRSIKQVAQSGTHLEIVNLVVPSLNDSADMLSGLVDWIAGELGLDVPIHFTRFHPDYQLLNLSPTPVETLERARDLAMTKGIHYAYVGNVPGHAGNHTYCPKCGKAVILRSGLFLQEMHLKNGACEFCGEPIAGVWN